MASSSSPLNLLTQAQTSKEVTANALFNSASPSMLYALRSTVGFTWSFYGGRRMLAGVSTEIVNGSVTLSASTTNYIEATPATGAVTTNTVGFTAGREPLYTAATGTGSVASYVDYRASVVQAGYASADQAAVAGTPAGTDAAIISALMVLTNELRAVLVAAGLIKGGA